MNKFRIWHSFLIALLYYGIAYLISYSVFISDFFDYETNETVWEWSVTLPPAIFTSFLLILVLFLRRKNLRTRDKKNKVQFLPVLVTILLGVLAVYIQIPLRYSTQFLPSQEFFYGFDKDVIGFDLLHLPFIISTVIFAPIIEEHIFRGIILGNLIKHHGSSIAVIISSVLFGLVHLPDFNQFVATIFGGFIAASIYLQFKKIIYPIIFHMTWNLIVILSRYTEFFNI